MRDDICEPFSAKEITYNQMRELSADEIHDVAGGVFENIGSSLFGHVKFDCPIEPGAAWCRWVLV